MWVYGYSITKKKNSIATMGGKIVPTIKEACQSQSNVKALLIFFLMGGVSFIMSLIHVIKPVNGQFYLEIMKHSREAEQRKRPEEWRNKTRLLHHIIAPVHGFLVKHKMTVIPQPPYSPDLAVQTFVPDVEIHSEKLSISNRRKFATGPTHYTTNRVPELENPLEAVYRQWRGVL
jgi:hypothetical protein